MESNTEKFPAQWALDLLEPTPEDRVPHFFDYHVAFFGGLSGLAGSLCYNYINRRPLHTRIHITTITTICCGLIGQLITFSLQVRRARADEMMRDYIRLHPERFPEPDNRKYAEVFQPWIPIR